jgi:lipopolysaccharide/colanic/teichoic acid biosynthesis glycosyltransferase
LSSQNALQSDFCGTPQILESSASGPSASGKRTRLASREKTMRLQHFGKRMLDIAVSVAGIVLLAPVFLILWLAIRLDSRGPAIFRQQRVGKDEKLFTCLKFRTLYHNASDEVHRQAVKRLWAGERLSDDPNVPYKLTVDVRVTRIGRWLRRTSLDELPQLFNVLRGEMSIVGPRPAIPYELEYFKEWHHERHRVKPGITGVWQTSGRNQLNFEQMYELDVYYVRTWSIWEDLKLIALTVPIVVRGVGAA